MHDGTITFDYMPNHYHALGVRLPLFRHSLLDGRRGITPPGETTVRRRSMRAQPARLRLWIWHDLTTVNSACGGSGPDQPTAAKQRHLVADLRTNQTVRYGAIMVRFTTEQSLGRTIVSEAGGNFRPGSTGL